MKRASGASIPLARATSRLLYRIIAPATLTATRHVVKQNSRQLPRRRAPSHCPLGTGNHDDAEGIIAPRNRDGLEIRSDAQPAPQSRGKPRERAEGPRRLRYSRPQNTLNRSPIGAARYRLVRLACVLGATGAGGGPEQVRMNRGPQQPPSEHADRVEERGVAAKAANQDEADAQAPHRGRHGS